MVQYLLNPRATIHRKENPIADRITTLNAKVIGLVDNSKINADLFLDEIEQLIKERFNISDVMRVRKSITGTPAPYTDEFFKRCDAVVNAFGD